MFAFGISVDAYMKKNGRFISSGIRWNQCAYAADAGKTLHLIIRHVDPLFHSLKILFCSMVHTCTRFEIWAVEKRFVLCTSMIYHQNEINIFQYCTYLIHIYFNFISFKLNCFRIDITLLIICWRLFFKETIHIYLLIMVTTVTEKQKYSKYRCMCASLLKQHIFICKHSCSCVYVNFIWS